MQTPAEPDPKFGALRAFAGKMVDPETGVAGVGLRLTNGNVTCDFQLDPMVAARWGAGLAQAIAAAAADAMQHNAGGLVVPQHQAGTGLFLPNGNGKHP